MNAFASARLDALRHATPEEAHTSASPRAERGARQAGHGSSIDGDPVDLWASFSPPELPRGLLPEVIERFARVQGEMMGADPAGLAMAALTTCAAAIPDRVQIQVKRHDPHFRQSARLWVALVGSPSTKKSPIISAASSPLCRMDGRMFRDWQAAMTEFNALPKEERGTLAPPPQRRLRISDTTVEATQQVLADSPDGVLLIQDELSGFFGAMDRYSGGGRGAQAERAFWLQAFNGGELPLNRVGRGASIIPNLSVCLLGGIQPEPIRKVAADAHDDGLLQRMLPIILKPATVGRDEPAADVVGEYAALVEWLHRSEPPPSFEGRGCLEFDDGALEIRRELEERHLLLQGSEAVSRKLAAHIGKYDGLFARLALTFHCIDHPGRPPAVVTEATARRAADFLHMFLLRHAAAFYAGTLGLSDDHDRLTATAGYILAHGLERITNRHVQRGDKAMRGLKEAEIRPIFEQLAALGWVESIPGPRPSSAPHWRVNPAVHRKFAARAAEEARRRGAAREAIAAVLGAA